MFMLRITSLFFLLCFVRAMANYYIDDSDPTAWKFENFSSRYDSQSTFGGTVHHNVNPKLSVGTLAFHGSSVEIYGVIYDDGCPISIAFNWPNGQAIYNETADSDLGSNILLVSAMGFNPDKISYVSFSQSNQGGCLGSGGIDYAIVYVQEIKTSSGHRRLIGIIVGSAVGGGVAILLILAMGYWVVRLRRKLTKAHLAQTSNHEGSRARFDETRSSHANNPTFTQDTRQLQLHISNTPPWPQPQS
ncbi:hypothetical protein DL96DRAFT_268601 [Flagelloscypha sp. PMI_526]|nr:hypothetical protein DL96DRAFT_268601 [Flagelloscypha sp. PMI_526]